MPSVEIELVERSHRDAFGVCGRLQVFVHWQLLSLERVARSGELLRALHARHGAPVSLAVVNLVRRPAPAEALIEGAARALEDFGDNLARLGLVVPGGGLPLVLQRETTRLVAKPWDERGRLCVSEHYEEVAAALCDAVPGADPGALADAMRRFTRRARAPSDPSLPAVLPD